ncbi:putative late blight resistance proteinR1A-10 [Sesamum angolense]|uniref:Late blight resistance proteinR1A-10 n=1 Tax=Sesamum angolense TaxID=2727404 RepID=A0AAE1WK42_9LAMI|nr:putative late blight resistance proteinR1A-10 [Sesamum angolense]
MHFFIQSAGFSSHLTCLRRLHVDIKQIQSLQEKVQFLLDFLEAHSQRISEEIGDLGRQIADAAAEAEEVVDRHVVDQLRDRSQEETHCVAALSSFCQDTEKVIGKIDSLAKELTMMVKEKSGDIQEEQRIVSVPVRSAEVHLSSGKKGTMVGFDEHLERIVDELTRGEPDLQILPIVGMGGIGKTTLAQNIFENTYIQHHFDKRIWVTVSQEYSLREILLHLTNDGKESSETLAELKDRLHKMLFRRRYLIVMDDVWDIDVWNELNRFFPNNMNESRILVTTRISNVGVSLASQEPYSINFLNVEKSWDLFCQETFAQEGCPYPELEEIGKNIAKSCDGLPLTIVVIGGLLANSNMTREYWESVAENVNAFRNSKDYERCLQILSLSYNSLPIHLKPCFLYMRAFPEDYKVPVSRLTKLWSAQGFLKPIRGKTLEEAAHKYLRELIDRNLFLSLKFGHDGSITNCGIHDLLRDLCLREYEKQHFMYAPKVQCVRVGGKQQDECSVCGLGTALKKIDLNEVHDASQLTTIASALVCTACRNMYPSLHKARLVRVRLLSKRKHSSQESCEEEILHPTSLRYLEVTNFSDLEFLSPSAIALLWNLETFSFFRKILLPSEIWGVPQLRHFLGLAHFILPDQEVSQDSVIMKNLQTVSNLRNFRCTKEVLGRIPNLKQLGISFHGRNGKTKWGFYHLHNLVRLHNLESLSIKADNLPLKELTFPTSLKELCLEGTVIPSKKARTIGSALPNLETLKLSLYNAYCRGNGWDQFEGEFPRLKFLEISRSGLKTWNTENIHFPNLETLFLSYLLRLEEIPTDIGDIPTLRSIHVEHCNDFLVKSTKQMVEEQYENGNESLQLYINKVQYQAEVKRGTPKYLIDSEPTENPMIPCRTRADLVNHARRLHQVFKGATRRSLVPG